MAESDLVVKFSADASDFQRGAAATKQAVDAVVQSVGKLTPEMKKLSDQMSNAAFEYGPWTGAHVQLAQVIGEGLVEACRAGNIAVSALGVAFGAVSIAAAASLAVVGAEVNSLRQLDDAARAAQISMAALRNLNIAGAAVGIDAGQMDQEMAGFAQKLREAQVAGGELADFLKVNNVQIKDAHGNLLPVQQIFGKIADLILSSNNEIDRLAALSKLGFSSDMLRLIERQTDAVKTFANSAKSAQDEVLKRGLSDGEALSAAWHSTWEDIKDVALSASVSILGAIGEIEHQGAAKFAELSNEAKAAFDRMAGDVTVAAEATRKVFEAQRNEVLRLEVLAVRGGNSPFGALDANAFGKKPEQAPPSDDPKIKGLYKPNSRSATGDNGETAAALKGYDDQIAAARQTERAKETLYAEGVKLHLVSEAQKFAATKTALAEEYNAEKTALQQELALDNLKPSQKQAINDKLKALDLKYTTDSEKLFLQSVEDQIRSWDQMVDTMSGSFSSGIMGMIKGTQTLRQTLAQVADAVTQQFLKMGVDMGADWAKAQIAQVVLAQSTEGQKTAAAMAGAAARGGIASGEATAGAAATLAAVTKSITASAGEAFAGVFGFLAPVMGPLAAGPAAAAQGLVLGQIGKYDIGAWNLDRDQLAMVHKNEMVMPAAEAGAFRSMLTGAANGGGTGGAGQASGDTHNFHINISAVDGQSVARFFANNSRELFRALKNGAKNGHHL